MEVQQLIKHLQSLPPNAQVILRPSHYSTEYDIKDISISDDLDEYNEVYINFY